MSVTYINSLRSPTNHDTGPIAITDSWLPRLGQYCAVLSASAIRSWEIIPVLSVKTSRHNLVLNGLKKLHSDMKVRIF